MGGKQLLSLFLMPCCSCLPSWTRQTHSPTESVRLEKTSKMYKSKPCCKPSFSSDQRLVLSPAACPQHRKWSAQGEKNLFTQTQNFSAHSKT